MGVLTVVMMLVAVLGAVGLLLVVLVVVGVVVCKMWILLKEGFLDY